MAAFETASQDLAEINKILHKITVAALLDPSFLARLNSDPIAVFLESGITFPAGKVVEVHQQTEKTFHFVLPMAQTGLSADGAEKYASMQNEDPGNSAIQGGARCTKP